jgi:MFS family permease
VEISPPDMKSNAVTYVLSGGIFAAILGPTGAKVSAHLIQTDYTGSFLVMALLGVGNWAILSRVQFPDYHQKQEEEVLVEGAGNATAVVMVPSVRPLSLIIAQPLFKLSCSIATIAHTVMVMIMSNCALSMSGDYSLGTASTVLEVHFLAMFLPGFFTGALIKSYGPFNVAVVGAVVFALSAIVFAVETSLWNYYAGMTLLGFAWNFSYSAATIMLMGCYTVCELPALFVP